MPARSSSRPDEASPPDASSVRFTIMGHAARLYHFPGKPDRDPPPDAKIIPDEAGRGSFWLVPEAIRLASPDAG